MMFASIEEGAPDPIFGVLASFLADPRPHKVNLLVGAYKDEEGKTALFESVKRAREEFSSPLVDYLPIDGDQRFNEGIGKLVFGEHFDKEKVAVIQTVGGTGALRIGGEFIAGELRPQIALSNPTWANHQAIFAGAKLDTPFYPYYNPEKKGVDINLLLHFFSTLHPDTTLLFHASCHNPTGIDLPQAAWEKIGALCLEKRLLPFFDAAYQGFGAGLDEDVLPIRLFTEMGVESMVAYSCSKNFSLYCQRVGALLVFAPSGKKGVLSKLKILARRSYSNPPAFGAELVSHILSTPDLRKIWSQELAAVRMRIAKYRRHLAQELDLPHLLSSVGMFGFLNLSAHDVKQLKDRFAIYVAAQGRINFAAITAKNLAYIVQSLQSL